MLKQTAYNQELVGITRTQRFLKNNEDCVKNVFSKALFPSPCETTTQR